MHNAWGRAMKCAGRILLVSAVGAMIPSGARAQCEGTWYELDTRPGVWTGAPYADLASGITSWDPDGDGPRRSVLVVVGSMRRAGASFVSGIAMWDGSTWQGVGSGLSGTGQAATTFRGKLIVGGSFMAAGGVPANNIAQWDGERWSPLGDGVGSTVLALSEYGGELIAAGVFPTAGGAPAQSIARWDGERWRALGMGLESNAHGFGGTVYSLTVHDGELVAGGRFDRAGGGEAIDIAAWDGGAWHPIGAYSNRTYPCGLNHCQSPGVHALASWNGDLFAGGRLLMGTNGGSAVARWDGFVWRHEDLRSNYLLAPECMTIWNSRLVIAGGYWTHFQGGSYSNFARIIDASGVSVLSDGGRFIPFLDGGFKSLTVHEGALYECGSVGLPGVTSMVSVHGVGRFDGVRWSAVGDAYSELSGDHTALAVYRGELISAGYYYGSYSGVAAWNGRTWRGLGRGIRYSPDFQVVTVRALSVLGDALIAGGRFDRADEAIANNLAKWDGQRWTQFGEPNGMVTSLLPLPDGRLVIGGAFTSVGGVPATNVAMWDGSWRAMGMGLPGSDTFDRGVVGALAVYQGEIYAGGTFVTPAASRLARWDGASWVAVGSTGAPNDAVWSIGEFQGDLIVGGRFTQIGTVPLSHVARNIGGGWQAIGSGFATISGPYRFFEFNGSLCAAGNLSSSVSATLHGVARWTGATWEPFAGRGMRASVRAAEHFNGELVFAGVPFDDSAALRWNPANTPWVAVQPAPETTTCEHRTITLRALPAVGFSGLTYRWRLGNTILTDGPTGHGSFIRGASSSELIVRGLRNEDGGTYRCEISSGCGGVTSGPALVTIEPGCCSADLDDGSGLGTPDRAVDARDFNFFIDQYTSGNERADLDEGSSTGTPDGGVTIEDLLYFLARYEAGC